MKNRKIKVNPEITALASGKCLSIVKPAKTGVAIVKTMRKSRFTGYLPLKDSPLWFNKMLSELKVIFEQFFIKYGTRNKVVQNTAELAYIYSVKRPDTDIPKIIPKPKTKFQKLSLFKRSLIQFIWPNIFKFHKLIVSLKARKYNLNRKLSSVMIVTLMASVANAGELKSLINSAEKEFGIPEDLLASIAVVESRINPYALNIEGKTVITKSLQEAKQVILYYLREGVVNMDIGVMQVNYRWHGFKFSDTDEMLDPARNIEYAARYLKELYNTHGSWVKAVRHYHSANPEYHIKYSRKIIITWLNS